MIRKKRSTGTSGTLAVLGLVCFGLGLVGCHRWHGQAIYRPPWVPVWKRDQQKEASFRVGLPGKTWIPMRESGVQVAWMHRSIPAVIQVRSQCQEHGDSSLEMFTDHLRIDYTDWKIVEVTRDSTEVEGGRPVVDKQQTPFQLVKRDALRTRVQARLDGAPVKMEIVVVKKNGCLFDLSLIAAPDHFEVGLSDFDKVVEGFGFPVKTT